MVAISTEEGRVPVSWHTSKGKAQTALSRCRSELESESFAPEITGFDVEEAELPYWIDGQEGEDELV